MTDREDTLMLQGFLLRQDARIENLHAMLSTRDDLLRRARLSLLSHVAITEELVRGTTRMPFCAASVVISRELVTDIESALKNTAREAAPTGLTVEEARRRGVCRVCEGWSMGNAIPEFVTSVNGKAEFAHTACLEKEGTR